MKRLIQVLSGMPMTRLKGDRDPIQVGARRAVLARLCSAIEGSRRAGAGSTRGWRMFTRDEAIALGSLFIFALREVGMQDVMASSEQLAASLHEGLLQEAMDLPLLDEATEDDLIQGAEQLSDVIVNQLEHATGEAW